MQVPSSQIDGGPEPPPPKESPTDAAGGVALAHDEIAFENAVARVALEEGGVGDVIAAPLLAVVDEVGPDAPAPATDDVDLGHGIAGVACVRVAELAALDHDVVRKGAAELVRLDLRVEVAQAAVPDAGEVGAAEEMKGVLAVGVDRADADDLQILEDPVGRRSLETLDGVELDDGRSERRRANLDRIVGGARDVAVQVLSDRVGAGRQRDHVARLRGVDRRDESGGVRTGTTSAKPIVGSRTSGTS